MFFTFVWCCQNFAQSTYIIFLDIKSVFSNYLQIILHKHLRYHFSLTFPKMTPLKPYCDLLWYTYTYTSILMLHLYWYYQYLYIYIDVTNICTFILMLPIFVHLYCCYQYLYIYIDVTNICTFILIWPIFEHLYWCHQYFNSWLWASNGEGLVFESRPYKHKYKSLRICQGPETRV